MLKNIYWYFIYFELNKTYRNIYIYITEKICRQDKRLRYPIYSFFNFLSCLLSQLILSSTSVLLLPPGAIIICSWLLNILQTILLYTSIFGKVPRSKDNRKQNANYFWKIKYTFAWRKRGENIKYYGWHFICFIYSMIIIQSLLYLLVYPLHSWILLLIPY